MLHIIQRKPTLSIRNVKILNSFGNEHYRLLKTQHFKEEIAATNEVDGCPAHIKSEKVFLKQSATFDSVAWENAKPFSEIPGPKSIPIIGNTWRFLPNIGEFGSFARDANKLFEALNKKFGDIVRIVDVLGQPKSVFLYNPNDIEMVYKVEGVLPKRDILPSMSYFRSNMRQDLFKHAKGLLTSQGDEWYDFRNKVNSIMMQPKMVKRYVKPVDEISKELVEKVRRLRKNDNKLSSDFLKELNKWALESIAFIGLNKKLNCLDDNLHPDSIQYNMIRLAEEIFTIGGKLDFEPSIWMYISTPTFRKGMRLYDEQVIMGERLIKEAMDKIEEDEKLGVKSDGEISVLEKLLKIDYKVAIVMALDMLLAGVDTTSTAMINILYYLAMNPSKQNKLRKEINSLLPRKSVDITADSLNSMPYLKACIKESARLYPVTPGTMRILTKDIVLSGYRIPKGTEALFPHSYLSVREDQFPSPEKFIPERWLREESDSEFSYKNAHPFSTMHFGFGSRSCVGRRFAELEMEIAVINIIRHFHLSWEGPSPPRITTTINYLKGPFNFIFNDVDEMPE